MRYEALPETAARELERWVEDGLVSAEQAAAIRSRYAADAGESRRGAIVQVLAVIGSVVAGLGVILFFAANWDAIPRPARVGLLLVALVGAYASGYLLRFALGTRPRVGSALLLLGGILFGATIFLVGQMYHVQAHDPLAFLLWTGGVAPTAAVLRSRSLATLSVLTLGGWLGYELVDRGGDEAFGYVVVAVALYGALLYAAGSALLGRAGEWVTAPLRQLGAVVLCAGIFVFTFRGFFGGLAEREPLGTVLTVALAAVTIAAGLAIALVALRPPRRSAPFEAIALAAAVVLVNLAVVLPETAADQWGESRAVVYPILFNLLLVALALGAIVAGYVNEEVWLVNVGVAVVAVEVFARYLDLFWDLLPRSLVFVGAGVLLLALAFVLERQRSSLIARMEEA